MGAESRRIVAAFEPFAGRRRNRSWEVVRRLPPASGVEVALLPVDLARIEGSVKGLLDRQPRALLLVGEAPGRRVRVEQVGLNLADSELPDNAGTRPRRVPLVAGGPLAVQLPWEAREVAERIARCGTPAAASFHAGTFACNAGLFFALHGAPAGTGVGFLHLPRRRWPLGLRVEELVRAVGIALDVLDSVGPSM